MTSKQRIREWQRMSECFHHHEMEMIKQHKKTMRIPPCVGHAYANDAMELEMERQRRDIEKQAEVIKQQQEAEPWMFRHEEQKRKSKSRMDIIGQNGNDGEHYDQMPDGRWNWYGAEEEEEEIRSFPTVDGRHPEPDATGAEDDLPYAAEDCARTRGSYEI